MVQPRNIWMNCVQFVLMIDCNLRRVRNSLAAGFCCSPTYSSFCNRLKFYS